MEIACRATKKLLTFSLMKNKNNRELEIEPSMESSNIAHIHTLRKLCSAFFADFTLLRGNGNATYKEICNKKRLSL